MDRITEIEEAFVKAVNSARALLAAIDEPEESAMDESKRCRVCGLIGCGAKSVQTSKGRSGTRCPRMDLVALAFVSGREAVDFEELKRRVQALTKEQTRALAWLAGQDTETVSVLLSILGVKERLGDAVEMNDA